MPSRPEITWSLLHPRQPDPAYLREVIAAAQDYQVDSFELCGEAHLTRGSLDGAIHFRDYPGACPEADRAAADATAQRLRECIDLAHASGRPVYYWHREVMVPRPVVERVPGLLDANGEFDLLGAAYHQLLRAKLAEFFERVPQLDGLVLTLTESNYSVIHNSNPERYPPVQVVQAVVTTFAEELARRGKRFVLRSFGSIARDYEDILAGAAAVDGTFEFEIETKITPYDFSPFLPLNPFLRRSGRARLSAEYDSIGEFLGAGYLPAPDPARVIECVRHAARQHVDRHVIRVDRIGHATFASTQAIHLHAFDRAIRDPAVTAEAIWREWAERHWPDCTGEMTALMQTGIELVKRTHFIDGHVIFHAFPIDPTMKWIKASGILSTFTPGASLHRHVDMWGINSEKLAPSRAALLAEKDEAVALADAGWQRLQALAPRLSEAELRVAATAWGHATQVTRWIRAWCGCVSAYVEDLTAGRSHHPALTAAIAASEREFASALSQTPHVVAEAVRLSRPAVGETLSQPSPEATAATTRSATSVSAALPASAAVANPENEYGGRERGDSGIAAAYAAPLRELGRALISEYEGEWAERAAWRAEPGLVDFVVCGGITDDFRVRRAMHASHAQLIRGRPARAAGNRVFPNGFIECELAAPTGRPCRLVVRGDRASSPGFRLTIDGARREARYDAEGCYEERLVAAPAAGVITVRIEKSGGDYPWIFGIATLTEVG